MSVKRYNMEANTKLVIDTLQGIKSDVVLGCSNGEADLIDQAVAMIQELERVKTWNKWFYTKVAEMRNLQKQYFKTRDSVTLNASKAVENEIDREIYRIGLALAKRNEQLTINFETK